MVIQVEIKVLCTIYKLAHGANILTFSELFAIEKSIKFFVIQEMSQGNQWCVQKTHGWLVDDKMHHTLMMEFNSWCGMSSVMGVIDNTHIAIIKLLSVFAKDYCFYKLSNCLYHSLLCLISFNVYLFQLIFQLYFLCIMQNFLQFVG
jgi:hypothetical protein